MPIEDLDLEFEEDDDGIKGKTDAVNVDMDLSFATSSEENSPSKNGRAKAVPRPREKSSSTQTVDLKIIQGEESEFDLSDTSSEKKTNLISSGNLYDIKKLQLEVENLKLEINKTQNDAQIKVAVAQAEKNFLVEHLSNAKVLDIQITQLLLRMNAKAPVLKKEAQQVKKLLNEFVLKSNPKK